MMKKFVVCGLAVVCMALGTSCFKGDADPEQMLKEYESVARGNCEMNAKCNTAVMNAFGMNALDDENYVQTCYDNAMNHSEYAAVEECERLNRIVTVAAQKCSVDIFKKYDTCSFEEMRNRIKIVACMQKYTNIIVTYSKMVQDCYCAHFDEYTKDMDEIQKKTAGMKCNR